jgi:hypothetical protein
LKIAWFLMFKDAESDTFSPPVFHDPYPCVEDENLAILVRFGHAISAGQSASSANR